MAAAPTRCPIELHHRSETMLRTAESAADARSLVRSVLTSWELGHLTDDASVVVSELVSNAVQHTRCRLIEVSVSRPEEGLVRVCVADTSRILPRRRSPDVADLRGRGLALVEALTCRWGAQRLPWGKRVWGEFLCEEAR